MTETKWRGEGWSISAKKKGRSALFLSGEEANKRAIQVVISQSWRWKRRYHEEKGGGKGPEVWMLLSLTGDPFNRIRAARGPRCTTNVKKKKEGKKGKGSL